MAATIYNLSRQVVSNDETTQLNVQKLDEERRQSAALDGNLLTPPRSPTPNIYQPMQRALQEAIDKVNLQLPPNADKLNAREKW